MEETEKMQSNSNKDPNRREKNVSCSSPPRWIYVGSFRLVAFINFNLLSGFNDVPYKFVLMLICVSVCFSVVYECAWWEWSAYNFLNNQ